MSTTPPDVPGGDLPSAQVPPLGVSPCFTVAPVLPVAKDYLRQIQRIAITDPRACPSWAHIIAVEPDQGPAVWLDEHEWSHLDRKARPLSHRVDLYTIQRGLVKVLEPKYDVPISTRQVVLVSLFDQGTPVLQLAPQVTSLIVQLALFDQQVYT